MFFKGRFGNGFSRVRFSAGFSGLDQVWFFWIWTGLFHRLDDAKKTDFIDQYNTSSIK
jgi:hypothetical protein